MEYVSCGTLRTFLQTQRAHLISDPELPSLLTIASYHIALAVQHLHSKMVTHTDGTISKSNNEDNKSIFFFSFRQIVHCDLALRNIMVNKFPWEVKLGEFGLARDMTSMASRRSYRWKNPRVRHHAHIHTHMLSLPHCYKRSWPWKKCKQTFFTSVFWSSIAAKFWMLLADILAMVSMQQW